MIHKFTVRPILAGPRAASADSRRVPPHESRQVWRDYYIETLEPLTPAQTAAVMGALSDGIVHQAFPGDPLEPERMIQVAHRAGITDNESDSLVAMCGLLGISAIAGKTATTYCYSSPRDLHEIEPLYNPNIEEIHRTEPGYTTLIPSGGYVSPEIFDLLSLDDDALGAIGKANGRNLGLFQMRQIQCIQEQLGAPCVTDVLLEALDARWSDHCLHTTWRAHGDLLARLIAASISTGNANIISMFHDNAGVWDFYDGWAIALKAETHNGPSAVSAYFGQLTKLGGVLRDILGTGLGADPIGCFEYTATGYLGSPSPIAGRPTPRHIALDTIRAIKEYGNTFGVPMMSSHMTFHHLYRAKPFALGGSVGLIPKRFAQRGHPVSGDVVLLIGGRTGREGVHGASASSPGAVIDISSVQIGSPLEEVKFRKAIIELRDADCIRAVTDLGGAGLNSAVGEMGEACGVWVNTALVPLKTSALPMWTILLSESQERMLLAVPPEKLQSAREILQRHQVSGAAIGRFVSNGNYCVFHDENMTEADVLAKSPGATVLTKGDLGFDVPYSLMTYDLPQLNTPSPPSFSEYEGTIPPWPSMTPSEMADIIYLVMSDLEVASQKYADSQYDSTVQGNTVWGPQYGGSSRVSSGYWAAAPVEHLSAGIVVAHAFDPWLYELHPLHALRQMFCRVLGTLVLAGVSLEDIAVCDNFYTPDRHADSSYWLVSMVDELASLVRLFGTPVISGKDSSAGSTDTDEGVIHVPPAAFFTAIGKVPDVDDLVSEQWQRAGNLLVRVGPSFRSPAGTLAGRLLGLSGGCLDSITGERYREYLRSLEGVRPRLASGCRVGIGGTLASLCQSSLASGLGVTLDSRRPSPEDLFTEHRCGAVIEIEESELGALPSILDPTVIGRLHREPGVWLGKRNLLSSRVTDRWQNAFGEALE